MTPYQYMGAVAKALADDHGYPTASSQYAFRYIIKELDSVGVTANIVTKRKSKKEWKYTYDVQINFEVKVNRRSRDAAKYYIFRIFLERCKEAVRRTAAVTNR